MAAVDGTNPAAQDNVSHTLRKHHIPCYMEGSIAYDVMVPRNRLREAAKALSEDPDAKRSLIMIYKEGAIPGLDSAPKK